MVEAYLRSVLKRIFGISDKASQVSKANGGRSAAPWKTLPRKAPLISVGIPSNQTGPALGTWRWRMFSTCRVTVKDSG